MGPPGAVTPFPHVCTVPGPVGLSGGAAAGTSRIGHRHAGRGDGMVLGAGAGSDLLVAFLRWRSWDAVRIWWQKGFLEEFGLFVAVCAQAVSVSGHSRLHRGADPAVPRRRSASVSWG